MLKLYRGRYLIALYNKEDVLIDVGTKPSELKLFQNRLSSFYEQVSRKNKSFFGCKLYLIDCLEKHNDIFKEEDEIFLLEMDCIKAKDYKLGEIAKQLGISKRTAYRWKSQGKLKGF